MTLQEMVDMCEAIVYLCEAIIKAIINLWNQLEQEILKLWRSIIRAYQQRVE